MCVLCVDTGVSSEAAVVEQTGGDPGAGQREPGGGAEWGDWLWQDYSGHTPSPRLII